MSQQIRAALAVWDGRRVKSMSDKAYSIYLGTLVAITAIAPVIRAIWVSVTSESSLEALASPSASVVLSLIVALFWAAALLLGGERGPAVIAPFLVHVFANSGHDRAAVFRRPFIRSSIFVTSFVASAALFLGLVMMSGGIAELIQTISFVVSGLAVGVVASVAWLTGQVFPKASVVLVALIGVAVAALLIVPGVQIFNPLVWIAELYPGGSTNFVALSAVIALAVAALCCTPKLLASINYKLGMQQALRWESATTHVMGMDFAAIATTYQKAPSACRHLRVVRPYRSLSLTFFIRGLLGSLRTPTRLAVGAVSVIMAGLLVGGSLSSLPTWMAGALAGLLIFVGSGAFTDSTRHAIGVAQSPRLFGISKLRFLLLTLLFPALAMGALGLMASFGATILLGNKVVLVLLISVIVTLLVLLVRVSTAMKGQMPQVLLTPIPSPVGDLSVFAQLFWAFDCLILAAIAGMAAVSLEVTPALCAAFFAFVVGGLFMRWFALVPRKRVSKLGLKKWQTLFRN